MRVSYAGYACHTWSRGRCPAPRNSHSLNAWYALLGTLHWPRLTRLGPLVDGGTRKRTHQAADHVTQHTPRTLFRLGYCHCTCCLVRPTARLASRSAIRMHFLADAACRIASNAGAKSDLGLCERTLTTGYSRDANTTALDATPLTQTPRTNSTHATRSATGGRLTKPRGTLDRRSRGYAGSARRENRTPRGATTRLDTLRTTCTVHSPSTLADVLFAFRRQGQYPFATCCLQGASKAKKRPGEISTT